MPGKKYDTDYMDSPIERGTPYKMNGHTLPGIKQNPRTKNMFAGEDGPFLKNGIGSKIKEGLGKVKNILSMSEKEKIDVIKLKKGVEAGAKVGGASTFQQQEHETIHGKFGKEIKHKRPQAHGELRKFIDTGAKEGTKETMQHIARSGSPKIGKRMKDTFKKGYKKLKSMKLGAGKLAR